MLTCAHCGAENPDGANVCKMCGKRLNEEIIQSEPTRVWESEEIKKPEPPRKRASEPIKKPETARRRLSEEIKKFEPTRRRHTLRPEEAAKEGAQSKGKKASPNEYPLVKDADYGETQPYQAKRTKKAKPRPKPAPEKYPSEYYPSEYYPQPYRDNRAQAYPPQYRDNRAQAYPPPVRRGRSRVPYLVVSFLTAAVSVLCFVLPYRSWMSFEFQLLGYDVYSGTLSFSDMAKQFYRNEKLLSMLTGSENEYLESMIPDSVNEQYAQGRLLALLLAIGCLVALVLFALMILAVLLRARGAAASCGIIGSLLYAGVTVGVMYTVKQLNQLVIEYDDTSWNLIQFRLTEIPYYALGLAALIFVLCILFAVLGAGTEKRN